MEIQSSSEASYLDILFLNRNKAYGSYDLRKGYDKRTAIGAGCVLLVIVLAALIQYFMPYEKPIEEKRISGPVILTPPPEIPVYKPQPPKPPKQQASIPKTARTAAFTVPDIVKDIDKLDKPLPTQKDLTDKVAGLADNEGSEDGILPATNTSKGDGNTLVKDVAPPSSVVFTYVSEMPQFDGNMNMWLQKHVQYPAEAKHNNIQAVVHVQFVVNEDGHISDAKVIKGIGGSCDDEALRVISNMPKWKAGRHNGKAVKVYFTIPIRFALN